MYKLKLVLIFILCLITNMQAQKVQWTLEQTNNAKKDVELINKMISLTESQKVLLTDIFLMKNNSLERASKLSASRRNWNVNVFLKRMEDILVYGYEIDRSKPGYEKEYRKELISKTAFEATILNNEDLRKELQLYIIDKK